MLREQKSFLKYKCLEGYCGKIVRQDKWNAHCKADHGFKFSLSVSSSSAERALSKLKIVKDRLRNSLCDDMLSSLLLIASEKDLMQAINNEDIINRITNATPSLKASLQYRWLNVDLERNWSDETIHNDYFYIWIIYSFETLNEYYNLKKKKK